MKKTLYSLLAGAMVLASCSKSDDRSAIDTNTNQTTFTLDVESATPAPQAKSSRTTSAVTPVRYVMEVWSADGLTPENVFEDGTKNHAKATSGSFTITLDKTKAYTCLFWADDNGTTYDATSLKAITIKNGKEANEAYHAKISVL